MPPAVGDGPPWPSPSSCSRFSSSLSSGRCSGSPSGRVGHRPRTRSRRRRAETATEAFAARDGTRPHDANLDFAWSTAATIEPWVEGKTFFPRIFADVEAARSSVHILMFGWREGQVGTEMADLLERKLAEGVEVRVIVDAFGSRPNGAAKEMFSALADAGAQIVVNDVLPLDRDGLYPDHRHLDWRQDEVGRADHRKLYVIDGEVAWTGGAGIEDHFENGGFHDVMVRVTGNVVRQAQAAFLTSFRGLGAPCPTTSTPTSPRRPLPGRSRSRLRRSSPAGSSPPRRRSASRSTARAGGST